MNALSDKEVGELWERFCNSQYEHALEKGLIRKLVEERTRYHWAGSWEPNTRTTEKARAIALEDFGIDPASWEK
jgi:hypothetical protein